MSDVLDDYLSQPRAGTEALTPEAVYANSGHRLLCGKCKVFRRTSITLIAVPDETPLMRIRCKKCDHFEDFVPTHDGWTPKWFADLLHGYMRVRAQEILNG